MLDFLPHASYLGIAVLIVLTGMGLPVPEELIVIGAGVAAHSGGFDPWIALAACLAGAVAGDCASYLIGRHFGRALLRDRHWFSRFLTVEREQAAERYFQRYGLAGFLFARFLVGLRAPAYMTAGILRIPFRWFLLADSISASVVVGLVFGLSYFFTDRFETFWSFIVRRIEIAVSIGTVVAAVSGVVVYFYLRQRRSARARALRQQRNSKHDDGEAGDESPLERTKSVA